MRTRALLVLALPAAWLACFSNDSGGEAAPHDGGALDASFDASFDSSPLADVSTTLVDAAEEPDAVDAAPSPVVVTVVGASGVEPGIPVAFSDATGASTGSATTNALGQVTATLAAGSMVTVLFGTPSTPALVTYTAVEPGDAILAVDTTSLPTLDATITSLPSNPPNGTATYDALSGGCSTYFDAPPDDYQLRSNCIGVVPQGASYAAAFPVVVEAYDENENVIGFTFQKSESIASQDAGELSFALGGAWSTATTAQTVSVSNEPDGGTLGGVNANLLLSYAEGVDGLLQTPSNTSITLSDGGSESAILTHVGFADFVQAEAEEESYDGAYAVAVATRSAPPTADGNTAIDLTLAETLPVFATTTSDFTTQAQPVVSWTLDGGSSSGVTALIASASWYASVDDGAVQYGTWTIVSPGTTATSLQAPALPAAYAGYAPTGTLGEGGQGVSVYAVQGTALPTLAAARDAAVLFPAEAGCLPSPLTPALPLAGTLAVALGTGGGCG